MYVSNNGNEPTVKSNLSKRRSVGMRRVDERWKTGRANGVEIPMDCPSVSEPKVEDGHPRACIPRINHS